MGKLLSKQNQHDPFDPDGVEEGLSKDMIASISAKFAKTDDRPILHTLDGDRRVDNMLRQQDLKAQFLKFGFQKDSIGVLRELRYIKDTSSLKQYELDITLAFWFAVHLEDLATASALMAEEFILKQLVACALIPKRGDEDSMIDGDEEDDEDGNGQSGEDENNSEGAQDANEDWQMNSRGKKGTGPGRAQTNHDPIEQSFKSENISEFENRRFGKQKSAGEESQYEGGEDEKNDQDYLVDEQDNVHRSGVDNEVSMSGNRWGNQQSNSESSPEAPRKTLGQVLLELKKRKEEEEDNKRREEERQASQQALAAIGISTDMIERITLADISQLQQIKQSFRVRFQNLMSNILKIALQKEEEMLACIITAYYEVVIEQEMLIKALSTDNYTWLKFVWSFDKNYIGNRRMSDAHFITFDQLFELISKQYIEDPKVALDHINMVVDWRIESKDNILIALLAHNHDTIAIANMGYYSHFLDQHLFIFCMMHGNNIFLQNALLVAAFDKMIFREELVISQILDVLKDGYRTNFLMNVLTLIDISVWKNKHMKDLIDIINDYVEENYDKNRLLLSPNPLMSIALASELLNNVGANRRKFENECQRIKNRLLELGRMYSAKIEDEKYYETLIMDQDFQGRTVIKIITVNSFESLMDEMDPKAENLIVMIWHGKEATRCDGNIYGYSNLMHIITTRAKKMSGKSTSFLQMVSNYFEPNFTVDYSFQYRYRSKAISFFFYKEFFCALAMLVIFQYINYKYLILFSNTYLEGGTDDSAIINDITPTDDGQVTSKIKLNRIINSIREYVDWNFFALFFSGALMFQLLLKLMFNLCGKKRIAMDKWTIMDSLSAILNIAAVQLIQRIQPESLIIAQWKDIVDYFMIFVLCICWLRFFTYFLVIRDISKLLLILIAMIGDTVAFMFIVCCFILIVSSVFTTLYQDTNPDKYGGLAVTARNLFDSSIGQYDYSEMGDRELSFSILQIVFVFFGNILLMNYLIAILSSTYENMKQTGIFKYKVNLYQYCERFMIAFEDKSYGEMVLHPPPLSYLSSGLLLFVWSSTAMKYITKGFSYLMHWLENLVFIGGFIFFEMALVPLAYVKIWLNIIANSMSLLKTIVNCIMWAIMGMPIMAFLLLRDAAYLVVILSKHQGCVVGTQNEIFQEEVIKDEKRVQIYNETRSTVIALYKRLQRHMTKGGAKNDDAANEEELMEEVDAFQIKGDEENALNEEEFLYQVKKSLIIDEWRKRCFLKEHRRRVEAKSVFKMSNLKNRLEQAFSKKLGADMTKKEEQSQINLRRHVSIVPRADVAKRQKEIQNQLKNVFLETVKKGAGKREGQINGKKKRSDEIDMSDFKIPESDLLLVDSFLTKFTIVSESSLNEHMDIMLMLKALPNKVTQLSLNQIEMFNFRVFQESLIAFQNVDLVNAFEYFDEKNRDRVSNVKEKLLSQKNNLNDVKDILELVKVKIERNEEHFNKNGSLKQ